MSCVSSHWEVVLSVYVFSYLFCIYQNQDRRWECLIFGTGSLMNFRLPPKGLEAGDQSNRHWPIANNCNEPAWKLQWNFKWQHQTLTPRAHAYLLYSNFKHFLKYWTRTIHTVPIIGSPTTAVYSNCFTLMRQCHGFLKVRCWTIRYKAQCYTERKYV